MRRAARGAICLIFGLLAVEACDDILTRDEPTAAIDGGAPVAPLPVADASADTTHDASIDTSQDASADTTSDALVDAPPDVAADASVAPIPWVDPARCVQPCGHPDESELVAIDAYGVVSSAGAVRVSKAAQPALAELLSAATAAGHDVTAGEAFRTYAQQASLWVTFLAEPGRSARPGHSEHELGLAIDLGLPDAPSVTWIVTHAAEHGFVLSYPAGREKQTGFRYESWHVRFVGTDLALLVTQAGLTLEEWLHQHPDRGTFGDCSDCVDPASKTDCTGLTTEGACSGTVLSWCFDGAAAKVDCAYSSLACVVAAGVASCGPPSH